MTLYNNNKFGSTRSTLLAALFAMAVFINGCAFCMYCWPELLAPHLHVGWQALCGMFGLAYDDFDQCLLVQHLAFVVLQLWLISLGTCLYYDRHVPSSRHKLAVSSKLTPPSKQTDFFGTVRFQWHLFVTLCLVAFSCAALSSLLMTDQASVFLIHYKAAQVQCLLVLLLVCCAVAYTVNHTKNKHPGFRYVSTLQAVCLVLGDALLYAAGFMGAPICVATVLVVNLIATFIAPLTLMVFHSHWSRWCSIAHQSIGVKRALQLTTRKHHWAGLRFSCMLRFVAVSNTIAWWISNAPASNGALPAALQSSMGALAVACLLTVTWLYLGVQLVMVTLALERKQAAQYWLPLQGWVLLVATAQDLCIAMYLSYVRFYRWCKRHAEKRLRKHRFRARIGRWLLAILSILLPMPCLILCLIWPWFGLDEKWLLQTKTLTGYIAIAKRVHMQYYQEGCTAATETGPSLIAVVTVLFTGALMVYGLHHACSMLHMTISAL